MKVELPCLALAALFGCAAAARPESAPEPVASTPNDGAASAAGGDAVVTFDAAGTVDAKPAPDATPDTTAALDGLVATDAPASTCDPDAKPQPNAASAADPPGAPGCGPGMAAVDAFCIDRWEAALDEVLASGKTQPWSPYWSPAKAKVRARSAPGLVPQGYVSGTQAAAACLEAGKRLCTDTEWLRACRGPQKWTYPYGNALQLGTCNDHRAKHPAVEYFGTAASWIWSKLGHPCINQLAQTEAQTGAFSGCVSAEQVHDLMGNLHEWTADPAGTFRGGFYVDTKLNGPGCLYATTAHDVGHWDYSTGFRCCADKKK
ncbi:MAG: hypothetical protein EXR79_06855 [Myxococcales bacterium]|nr:hypothetical protein [Myxococcales bacterium]